jgi:hypothetical protein
VRNHKLRAEANFLRLPLFALDRHPVMASVTASGSYKVDDQEVQWSVEVTPAAKLGWPGPLARSTHWALLAMATERRREIVNPITWRWLDLFERRCVRYSGAAVLEAKRALRAIHGLSVWSQRAIYDAARRCPVESGEQATHLFERLHFHRRGTDDRNMLWLSEWYLANLNVGWCRLLDYDLWRRLDAHHHVASRIYEYLLYGQRHATLSIRYPVLASYLPVRPYGSVWEARRQLNPHLKLLVHHGVLADFRWEERADCVAMLKLSRGSATSQSQAQSAVPEPNRIEVRTIPPAEALVNEWYDAWYADVKDSPRPRPNRKDIALMETILSEHGLQRARQIVKRVVTTMKKDWPDAKTFSACEAQYLPLVVATLTAEMKRAQATRKDKEQRDRENAEARRDNLRRKLWLWRFSRSDIEAQEGVRSRVGQRCSGKTMPKSFFDHFVAEEISNQTKKMVESYLAETGKAGWRVREIPLPLCRCKQTDNTLPVDAIVSAVAKALSSNIAWQ